MQYSSKVIRGQGRGGPVLGFPTFNLNIPENFDYKDGVYACHVWINGKEYRGALHYGPVPTFDQNEKTLEIYVLDYSSNDVIEKLTFELGSYLRPVATFIEPRALRAQIALDVSRIRRAK